MSTVNTRIISKHDTTENWNNAQGFIPMKGEIIVYDDFRQIGIDWNGKPIYEPGIKVGTGNAYIQDLPFVGSGHENNNEIHITEAERLFWNNKLNVIDPVEFSSEEEEELVFNRN